MTSERAWVVFDVWPSIAAVTLATAGWMSFARLTIDWESALPAIMACACLEALAQFYRTRRREPKLSATLSGISQLVAFSAVAAALSYAVARTGGPVWDETLWSWDRSLGLDWRAYLAFVDARPWMGLIYTLAYRSLSIQIVVVMTILGFTGRLKEARSFVLAFMIAAIVTILLSGLMPAMAMFVYLKLQPHDFSHLEPAAAFVHVAALQGLRDGTLRVISISGAEGIITFPSFHAALGILFILALWPVRQVRWPVLILNLVLIAATPIDGGHYFVDVMAGGTIAALAMLAAQALVRHSPNGTGRSIGHVAGEVRLGA